MNAWIDWRLWCIALCFITVYLIFISVIQVSVLANFFINIGRADVLGSGVRNLYKFSKMYSGKAPEFIDGDVFKTIVPLSLSLTEMSDKGAISDKMSDNAHRQAIVEYIAKHNQISAAETATLVKGEAIELGVILAAFYGLRRAEAVGLKWGAIDFEQKTISIRHTV